MRQVRARGTKAKTARGRGRSKAAPRKAQPRTANRGGTRGSNKARTETRTGFLTASWGHAPLWRRPMLILMLILLVGGGGAGVFAGGYMTKAWAEARQGAATFLATAGFTVQRITLAGNERSAPDAVYAALALKTGQSIFSVDPAAARARLRTLPWVADAVVRRRFPDTVAVTLIEKRPFALWRSGAGLEVVERSGAIIAGADPSAFPHLPLLIGKGAPAAAAPLIDALGRMRAVSARLRAVERISERRWDLILDPGVRVNLPEMGWEQQLPVLEKLIVDDGVLEHDIEIIDLRYPDRYIFRLHNGDSRPVSRQRPA